MAAPSHVATSPGTTDAGGDWSFSYGAGFTVGHVVIFQVFQDGATNAAVALTSVTAAVENLAGTGSSLTKISGPNGDGSFPVGGSGEARQHLWIGRIATTGTVTFGGTNSTSEDLYVLPYEFQDVSTGTTLATVIENWPGAATITQASNASNGVFGRSAVFPELVAQSFTATGSISGIAVSLLRAGSDPGDSAVIEIRTDSAGVPSDTVLGSGSIAWASLTGSPVFYDFSIPLDLTSGTTYWIVAHRSGALSGSDQYAWNYDNSGASVYAGGLAATRVSGGSWATDANRDQAFKVYGIPSTSVGTSNTASDAAVTTLGPDRLALNFVAVNDDNAISAFTGESGGDWVHVTGSPYAESSGTDGAIGLQAATISSAGTIDGGTGSIVDSDAWGVVGFALIGTTVPASALVLEQGYVNYQDPGVL